MDLPNGTVTFLMTDVAESTRLWEQYEAAMSAALARHDALAAACIAASGGLLIKERGEGDSLFAVFARATDAVEAACRLQQAFLEEPWAAYVEASSGKMEAAKFDLRVRMALHTGETHLRGGDYYGATVNRCARIRATAHGGQVLLSQATCELVRDSLPGDMSLRDLGWYRLRDLQRPERIFQLAHPSWSTDFPPLLSLELFRHNLPQQITSFIGRGREIAEVKRLLGKTRLLTLTGSGGCGKTRLALQVAAEVLDQYSDGVWLVELALISDAALVPKTIATMLHLAEEAGSDPLHTLCEQLKKKSLLLILDNCEHLEQACAQAAYRLLLACPNLRILATSRSHFSLAGETTWRVPSLPAPPANRPPCLNEALQYESIQLFVERATSVLSQFVLTESNLPAVIRTCRRLDGIPLAIELAAARVSALSVEQLASRLDHNYRLLASGNRTGLKRHQTLQALIDWSYNLLPDPERMLLRRLSVFVGGWMLEAAETVCSGEGMEELEVLDLLSRLVDTSLVLTEEHGGLRRYRLLEAVRQYAREKLEQAGETVHVRTKHLTYFLALSEEAEPNLTTATQATWLARLEQEHDNLRAALAWAVEAEIRLRLASALWRFWMMRGHLSEGRSWLESALAGRGRVSPALRAKALNGLGVLVTRQSDYTQASSLLQQSREIYQNLGDSAGVAQTLSNLGNLAREQGDYTGARLCYEQSLALRRAFGDRWGTAACLNNLGMVMYDLSDYAQARAYYAQSLEAYRALGDTAQTASVSANLGMVAIDLKDYATACSLLEESLKIFRAMDNRWAVAVTLDNLGQAVHSFSGSEAAYPLYLESLRLLHELGDYSVIAFTLAGLARVARDQGDFNRAARLLGAAATIREEFGTPLSAAAQEQFDLDVSSLRSRLSQEAFDAEWNTGKALPLDEIVAYAAEQADA